MVEAVCRGGVGDGVGVVADAGDAGVVVGAAGGEDEQVVVVVVAGGGVDGGVVERGGGVGDEGEVGSGDEVGEGEVSRWSSGGVFVQADAFDEAVGVVEEDDVGVAASGEFECGEQAGVARADHDDPGAHGSPFGRWWLSLR